MNSARVIARAADPLGVYLDALVAQYHTPERIAPDPLQFVREYADPLDQEIAGFFAAGLAFGGVQVILANVGALLAVLGDSPRAFIEQYDPARDGEQFDGFVHRWIRGPDVAVTIELLQRLLERHESLGHFYAQCFATDQSTHGALSRFSDSILAFHGNGQARAGVRYFFANPQHGSACKRLNLYLRWMIRRDAVDPGPWAALGLSPADLIMPLDTHIARIARNLGLTRRATPGWKMAGDITARLREFSPHDPVKYDFSLCRLGILRECPPRRDPLKCARCGLLMACERGYSA